MYGDVCVCIEVCVRVYVEMCVRVCVDVWVEMCVCVDISIIPTASYQQHHTNSIIPHHPLYGCTAQETYLIPLPIHYAKIQTQNHCPVGLVVVYDLVVICVCQCV